MAATFIVMRAYLHLSPNTDLNVGGYNIHHLFTGLVLLTAGAIPAILLPATHRWSLPAIALFGVGLALALDEWLYLIVTDGTNASYITPVSFVGGFIGVTAAIAYTLVISRVTKANTDFTDSTDSEEPTRISRMTQIHKSQHRFKD
jgi:hypothetical protein